MPIISLAPAKSGYSGYVFRKLQEQNKYGYIVCTAGNVHGRVYFRESSLVGVTFDQLMEGTEVEFGFGPISSNRFGAINVVAKAT